MDLRPPLEARTQAGRLRIQEWTAGAVVGLMLLAEALAVRTRYFVNDDYQMLYTAWLQDLGKVGFRDFGVQSYHILPTLLRPFFHVFGYTLAAGMAVRGVFLLGLALLPILSALLSSRIFGRESAPFAAVASLASWPVLERGLDIRPDLLLALTWLALLIALSAPGRTRARSWGTGVLLGLALILRAKTVLLVPTLVGLEAMNLWRSRPEGGGRPPLGPSLRILAGLALTLGLFALYLLAFGQWGYFTAGSRALGSIAHQGLQDGGVNGRVILSFLAGDYLWVAILFLGLASFLLGFRTLPPQARILACGLLLTAVLFVALDPAFYSYNFVILLPLLAPFAAAGCLLPLKAVPHARWSHVPGAVLLVLLAVFHGTLLWGLARTRTNRYQVALAKALAATAPDTHVFALEGVGLFRPSIRDWRFSAVSASLYHAGRIDLRSQLEAARPEILILNYRLPGWLTEADQTALLPHYVLATPQLAVLAAKVDAEHRTAVLDLARSQPFILEGGPCRIDGERREARATFRLMPGRHAIEFEGAESIVVFHWPEAIALRDADLPYLLSPETSLFESAAP